MLNSVYFFKWFTDLLFDVQIGRVGTRAELPSHTSLDTFTSENRNLLRSGFSIRSNKNKVSPLHLRQRERGRGRRRHVG